jgi:hypothetical protein
MVEPTRAHTRIAETHPEGQRFDLSLGKLFIPLKIPAKHSAKLPLLVFFHAPTWLVETAATQNHMAAISATLGSGMSVYEKPFTDQTKFLALIDEAQQKSGMTFGAVTIGGWSAGGGAVRQILLDPTSASRIARVIIIDGMHTGYTSGKPGPQESTIDPANLASVLAFARQAVAGHKTLLVTHSEIFPGTYASTTETAHYLAQQLQVKEEPILCWGPGGMQAISRATAGNFTLVGYAGNTAPDHIDQVHALGALLANRPLTKSCARP